MGAAHGAELEAVAAVREGGSAVAVFRRPLEVVDGLHPEVAQGLARLVGLELAGLQEVFEVADE